MDDDVLKELYRSRKVDNRVTDFSKYQAFLDAKRKKEEEEKRRKERQRKRAEQAVDDFDVADQPVPIIGSN